MSVSWNVDGVQVTSLLYVDNENIFFRPLDAKWRKIQNLSTNLQDMYNHILKYDLSTSRTLEGVQASDNP